MKDAGEYCALLGRHDYRPSMFRWVAAGRKGLPPWHCAQCGAERPPLTAREKLENLAAFLEQEATRDAG